MAKKRSTILSGLKESAGNTPQRGSDIEKTKEYADREEILSNLRTAAAGGDLGGSRINEAYAEYRQKKEQARADRYQSLVRDTQSLFDENGRLNSGVTLPQLAQLSQRTREVYKERTDSNAEYLRSLDNYLRRLAGGQVAYGMTRRLLPEEQRDALRDQIAGITAKKTQTPQERSAQDEAAEREASGYVSPENYAASIRANQRAAGRIRAGGVVMSDGRYHVGRSAQEELDRLAQSTARSELAMRAQEDETAMFRGSDYWLQRANELEQKRKASRYGYGGMMQGGTAFRETPEFTEQDRQDWDKAREYYYQVKNAERWGSMPEDLRRKALEAAGYVTDSVLTWQDGDEAALAGMTPDQRAQRQRDQRARRNQIAAILAGAGYEPEEIIEYASRVRNAERMQQEMAGLSEDVTGRGAEGVARGVYGTVQSYATNLLSPIGSVGLLAQKLFRGGAGAEQYRPVDYNTPSMYFSQGTSTIRGAVGGQMGDVGRFFYDTVNSAVDSGVRMLVGQALGGGGIKPSPDMTEEAAAKLNRFVSGFISTQMSGEVFANSFVQAKENGSTDADALLDSVTSALIEGLTEKYSVESILRNPNGLTWTALRNSFLAEGSEEMASDFLNTIYDELKNGDDSELRTQYRELLASGATENDAFNRVFGDYVKQVVLDGLAGGLSGIAMSGVAEYATNKRYEAAYADPADTQALLDEARAVNPDSRILRRAEQRVAEGKGVTGYQARELMGRNEEKLAPLKQASAKYGKQSGAMQATYQEGQDVAQYDMSYRVAYEMGKAGTKLSAAQTSTATDYLTDAQKQAAWSAGRDARTRLSDVSEVANGRALLNGQIVQVQTISAQDGKLMAEVRQGESVQTVALDSLKVDAGTRTLAEGAKQYGSAAGTVFEQYKAGQDVAAYLRAADMAAAVGMASPSASSETVLKNLQAGQLGKALSGEQITAIYKAGQTAGRAQLRKTGMTRLGTGTVTFEQSAKGAKLNAQQKASVQFIRDLAKVTGIDFTIYKSSADSTGRLQGANGAYRDGTVHVDLNAGAAYEGKLESASMLRTVSHELTHYMAEAASTEFSALQDFMVQRLSQWEGHSIQDLVEGKMATAEQAGHPITAQEALEEVVADGCEMMLRDSKAVQQLAEENRTLFEKVRDWMKKFFESLRKAFEGVEAVHPESIHMMENYAGELQKLWDDAFTAAVKNAKEGALGTVHADLKAADTLMNPTQEAAFSLRDNEKFQENAEKKNEALGLVPVNVMRSAAEARSQIAEIMRDPKLRDALNLPDDFSGKTYFADGAYNGTEENTTVCPRSMGAEELLDAVSELLGRPLTVDECINISQFMAGTEIRPECEYCYVAIDRKAYREFLGRYVEMRDAVLRRMENGMTDAENYRQLLNGRKDTKDMRSRFGLWAKTARSGGQMMQASDLTNVNKLMHDIIEPGIRAQVKDAMRYAQNASWAKKRIGYTAYNGHILNWSKDKITKLNKGFGLRMYSFSDFSPAFILENMQMITDASVRGLKMLAYTKDLDFVRIFAPSGININVSVFGFERNGVVAENALQGASWAEAQKLRAENPNVGITFVATNDTLVNWALAQDWIDVVIPYHLVRTGKQVAQRLGFTNYTAESSDVKQAGWTKGNAKEILPTQHNNDLQTYLRALEENNLRPRFERFLDNPNYMKLVNETRRSALETPAVQPVFDVEAAKKSLIGMIKDGGYFQHIGGSVDRMYEIASDLSQKIYEGVKFSDRDSAGRELSAEQAEYFKDSKVRDKDGNLLVMYHQTDGAFTVFDTKHDGAGARDNETPFGIFLKTTDRDIGVRGKNQMALYANITNPLHAENRADLVRQLRRLSPEYDRLKTESGKLDAEYGKKHEAAKKAFVDFLVQWRRDNPTASRSAIYDDPEFNAVYDAEDNVVTEWQERQTALDTQAKEAIAEALRKNGYDGVILARDAGSFGRSTDAYIALDANQVKNPDNLAPTKNPDIRYSDRDNRAQKSIKDQIRANAAALSEMKSVANIRADLRGMNIKEKRQWAENVLKASGYRVDRQAFGVIAFEPRHINEGLNYFGDDGEIAAFAALPQLLKRGKIIDVHNNHKGRDLGTVTIAAPVEINGVRGNMAAVVKRTGKDHYHTHRILMPDGSAFEFLGQENTEPKPAGALSETDTHATPMDPVSESRIAQKDPTVKRQERDTVSAEIATLQRDLRQMRAELKRLKGSEGQVDLAAAAQYDAREALRAAKADAQEAREQGILAGQMAQGRQDAKAMNRLEAKLAQERAAGAEGREALRAANRDIRAKDKTIARNDAAIQRLQDRIARTEERLNDRIAEQRQRLTDYRENRNETEAARRQRAQIEARCEELTRMLTQNNDKQHIPEPLKQPVKELLEALTPSRFSQSMQERGTETQADARLVRSLEKIRRVAADQAQGKLSDLGYLDLPPEFLDDIDDIFRFVSDGQTEPLYAMNSAQLKELNQVLTVLTTSIKQINRLITAGHFESVRDAAEATALDLDSMRERKLHFGLDSKAGKAEDVLRNFLSWKNTTPYYAFRRFGEGGQDMFRRLADGWDRLAFNSDRIIRFAEDTYTEKEVKAWEKEKHTVTLDSGEVITLSTANAMELYELSRREQAQGHLYGGGVRISGQGIRPVLLTAADVENIAGFLSERQKAVADKLQQYMEIQGSAWGNEVSMERFGYRYFTEPHYYPVVSDSNELIARDTEAQENSMFRLLNLSATKGLREGANNAIVIGSIFDTFANHMSDMAKYNALALPILDTMKWFNYRDTVKNGTGQLLTQNVKQSIEAVYGSDALRYFTTFIKDLNGVSEGGRGEGFANRMISNYKVAAVAANLRVALLQPTAYVRAANVISPKYLTLALKNAPKALWNASGNVFRGSRSGLTGEMLEHSGIALWKSLGFYDTNIGRGVREQIKNAAGIKEKVVEKSMSLAELGDTSTWTVIWSACKLEQKAKGYTGQALLQQTAERFREVVYATQVVDSTMTRSHMMRSKSTFSKLSTAFMSEPTLSYNMLLDAAMGIQEVNRRGGNGWKAKGGKLLRAFTVFASTAAASALVESLFDAFRDDDDEDAITKFINALFGENLLDGNLGQNLLPIGSLPYLKDAVSILQGYSNERMDTEFISKIVNTAKIWAETYKLETGELDKATKVTSYGSMTTWGKVYKTLDALSSTAGLPLAATTREVTSIWNATIGAISPRMKIKRYESKDQKLEWLYSFAQSGSTADYEKELAGLRRTFPGKKTEEEITESIQDGLRGKIKDHYLDGDLTEQEAQRLIERYTGRDAEEAEDDVNRWHYQRDTGDTDASASMAAAWYGIAEPAGIDREAFAEAWAFHNDVEADKDESGKTVPGSKKQKVVDYIQGLGLSRDQEKALWDALKGNWKDTDTPWE